MFIQVTCYSLHASGLVSQQALQCEAGRLSLQRVLWARAQEKAIRQN